MNIDLNGKRVLVTGGNSGLGAAIAHAFAKEGANVAINYVTNPQAAQDLMTAMMASGSRALAVQTDITDAQAVNAMFGKLDEEWGGIDVLINNAGIDGHAALSWDCDPADWAKVIDINLKGAFLCAQQALKRMVKQKAGVIINTSSVHEIIPWSGYSAYTASKAGLSMMAKTLALEAAPHGVRVLCIAPGAIKTSINSSVWRDKVGYQDLLTKIPLGRVGVPEDVSRLVVVLASDVASYVTGTTIFIDGGMTDYPNFAHGG
ncbi:MAG: glucose 1-dehydrogenase [Betaproteobacteria bacterium]